MLPATTRTPTGMSRRSARPGVRAIAGARAGSRRSLPRATSCTVAGNRPTGATERAVEQLPAAGPKRGEDVLEIGRRRGEGADGRGVERPAARGQQPDTGDAARDLEAPAGDVLMRNAVAEQMRRRAEQERPRRGVPAIAPTSAPVATWSDTITATPAPQAHDTAPSKEDRGRDDSREHVERPQARRTADGLNAARGCGDAPRRRTRSRRGEPARAAARSRAARARSGRGRRAARATRTAPLRVRLRAGTAGAPARAPAGGDRCCHLSRYGVGFTAPLYLSRSS